MIRVSRSIVGPAEQAAVQAVLARGFLGTGPETQLFEQELAAFIGGEAQVACVNTGTSAVHLALQACGIGPGDEVLVPTLTYVASFQAVAATGATPVACDVREEDGLLDLVDAAKRLSPRTRAVMPVHYASHMGDLDAVYAFAASHDLRVIEDAAHAFGCAYQGRRIGSFGDVICFSFDGIKNITSGEGGAVVSRDPTVMQKVQDARLLGVEKDTEKRYRRERSWEFEVSAQGWRYHMSDIMAAIGRVQLQRFEGEFKPARQALAAHYRARLNGVRQVKLLRTGPTVVPHIFPVRLSPTIRDAVRTKLEAAGIQTGMHYKPSHLLAKFRPDSAIALPVAENLYRELLTLPLHPGVTPADADRVVDSLVEAIATCS